MCLLGDEPPTHELMEAARKLADIELHLLEIRDCRRIAWNHGVEESSICNRMNRWSASGEWIQNIPLPLAGQGEFDALRAQWSRHLAPWLWEYTMEVGMSEEQRHIQAAAYFAGTSQDLHRLNEYERKALSRRTKAMRQLDYLLIEARRQRRRTAASSSAESHQGGQVL